MKTPKDQSVMWWIGWIVLTILTFFVPCYFWTKFIAERVGPMTQPGVPILWVAAVFGTWMVFLVPLIVMMYNKVDKAYEDARNQRERLSKELLASRFPVPAISVDEVRLVLPKNIQKKLKRQPKIVKRKGQLVTLKFRDGSRLENTFIFGGEEIVGVYDRKDFPFDAREVVDAEVLDGSENPPVDYMKWLRVKSKEAGE